MRSPNLFIDVFLFFLLVYCLKKLHTLNALPDGTTFFIIVVSSLVAGAALDYLLKRIRQQKQSMKTE